MSVADATRYARGDRDDEARAAATAAYKKWRVQVARNGHSLVDAKPVRHQLRMLHRRMTWERIAEQLPITLRYMYQLAQGKSKRTSRKTAEAVEALWFDYCGQVERDTRRWPIQPFKEAVIARYGSIRALGNKNQTRQIWRGGDISTKQAEDYADSLDLMPSDIWPDWYLT